MYQTENPTQTVVGTPVQATGRDTERVGKSLWNMACSCGAYVRFLRLTSTGCSLADSRCGVQPSIGRYQDIRHLLGELHVAQAVVDGSLTVGIPQQVELGTAARLFPEA